MSDWPIKPITEIVDFNPPRKIKRGSIAPFIDMASLPTGAREVFEVGEREFKGSGSKFQNGDTLFARITPCLENGKTAKVTVLNEGDVAHGSTEFIVMSAKDKLYDEDFVYYLARLPEFRNYAQSRMEGTSGRQRVPWQALATYELQIPPKEIRKQIGDILCSIDDKIELNRQINQTLEQITQAIFKSWFVDFEPVKAKIQAKQNGQDPERAAMRAISGKIDEELDALSEEQRQQLATTAALFPNELEKSELGEIPRGWRVSTIGEEVDVLGGGTPSTKNEEFWVGGEINWTSPKDLSGLQGKILLRTEKKITEAGLAKISSGLLPVDTVLMSSRAPVGYLAQAKVPVAINQGYIAMKCSKRLPPEFVLLWADSVMDEIKQRASGSTFAEISKKNFRPINVVVPTSNILFEFEKQAKLIYDKITESESENASLINIRDSLLPKLLSGQIEV
jgi:type I restriction enzyme S subunit